MTQICEEWAEKEKVNLTIEPWGRWGLAHADKLRAWRSSHFWSALSRKWAQEMGVAATRAIARARSCTKFSLVAAGKAGASSLTLGPYEQPRSLPLAAA
jgi:hypothetical protein